MSENRTFVPKRGDMVIHEAQDGESYICIGWIGSFVVLMSIRELELSSQFWFQNWENTGKNELTIITLPDPVREAWISILPKEITPTPETALDL